MRYRYITPFIVLVAGLITSISNILHGYSMIYSLSLLLVVLIIFYIIGLIVRDAFIKVSNMPQKPIDNPTQDEENSEIDDDE